jgi:APA family basic amino acid/polyamine antiporter
VLTTALIAMNYTRGLVDLFTFIILLSTLNTLIPYVFSALAIFILPDAGGARRLTAGVRAIATGAFLYTMYAVGGAGQETVYWGFLLILAGLPVYVLMLRTGRPSVFRTAPRE